MSEDLIKVYRVGDEPLLLPRSEIIWTDGSRMREMCPRKRYYTYHYGGTGYIPTARNEDLLIGAAVHEGVDLLMQGGSINKSLDVAKFCYLEGKPWGDWLLPEQKEILTQDGLHLVQALVYAFFVCYLDQYKDQYEVLEVEEEINWLVRRVGNLSLVCMSRPDAILRHRESGRLWHVSHKTSKRFDESVLRGLDVDVQRFAEGYAIWAKYGESIEGTLYNYFIKGDRRRDETTGMDRYTTGLIRPYIFRQSGGDLTPEMVRFPYEWDELNIKTGKVSKSRPPKGWEKSDIYKEMDFMTYLEWLREKWVQRAGSDYLLDSQAGMVPVFFDQNHARRWLDGIRHLEEDWYDKAWVMSKAGQDSFETVLNHNIPLAPSQCFSYNHRCQYFNTCWRGRTPESLLEQGDLTHREPNHLQEFYEVL
jgi:hypothetical protein